MVYILALHISVIKNKTKPKLSFTVFNDDTYIFDAFVFLAKSKFTFKRIKFCQLMAMK